MRLPPAEPEPPRVVAIADVAHPVPECDRRRGRRSWPSSVASGRLKYSRVTTGPGDDDLADLVPSGTSRSSDHSAIGSSRMAMILTSIPRPAGPRRRPCRESVDRAGFAQDLVAADRWRPGALRSRRRACRSDAGGSSWPASRLEDRRRNRRTRRDRPASATAVSRAIRRLRAASCRSKAGEPNSWSRRSLRSPRRSSPD